MTARFHRAMMWLLLLALPLQGLAAATMLACGPNHQQMWESSVAGASEPHHHIAPDGHHQPMPTAGADHGVPSGAAAGPSVPELAKLSKFTCSACAACCIGVALPMTALMVASFPPAIAPSSFVPASHVGFFTDGPDRPPRLSLV